MRANLEVIRRRAVKKGIKVSKKTGHLVSPRELLALRIQTMPAFFRISLVLLGAGLLTCASLAWPYDSAAAQGVEFIGGVIILTFGIFGIRRTLSKVLDSVDSLDIVSGVIEVIGEALNGIDI